MVKVLFDMVVSKVTDWDLKGAKVRINYPITRDNTGQIKAS